MAHISISMDPPIHTEMRRVAQRGFLKPVIDALEPEIEARAHRIIDRLADRGTGRADGGLLPRAHHPDADGADGSAATHTSR